ncbi:MAG: hypothetical protein JWR10_1797 [Rubritepida sp.]|nr:hypothetical protein [Rubritepida sp.]
MRTLYKHMRNTLGRRPLLGLAAGFGLAAPALAQPRGLPTGAITIVVPFTAGSTNDIAARLVAPELMAQLGQSVVVENRPGAGGTVGIGQVIRARPDGLTLVLVSSSSIPINRALYRNLAFDPARDLTMIGMAGSTPNALMVSAASGITSLAELIALAKRPGQPPIRYYSPGNGTAQQLSCVQIAMLTGMPVENVTYRGPVEGITALMTGEVAYGFATVPSVVGLVRDGLLRSVGTTGPRPSTLAGVPTLVSLGYPGFLETDIWFGIAASREVPAEGLALLRGAFDRALAGTAMKERLARAGFDPVPPRTPAQFDAFITSQVDFWAELVRSSGTTLD